MKNALRKVGEIDPSPLLPLWESGVDWISGKKNLPDIGEIKTWNMPLAELDSEFGEVALGLLGPVLRDCFCSEVLQLMLSRLRSGFTLPLHADARPAQQRRLHVPLVTNPLAEVTYGGEWVHLPVGKVYEVDFRVPHSGRNLGDHDRVHLIVDFR